MLDYNIRGSDVEEFPGISQGRPQLFFKCSEKGGTGNETEGTECKISPPVGGNGKMFIIEPL